MQIIARKPQLVAATTPHLLVAASLRSVELITPTLLAVALFGLCGTATSQAAWPDFRGPDRNGVASTGKPPLEWSSEQNLKWKTELPGAGSSSPIVIGDRVLLTCYSGYGKAAENHGDKAKLVQHVVCVARKTGKLLWNTKIACPLDKDARQVIIQEHGFASPTPITDGRRVFAYFGKTGLVALDLEGEILWKTSLGVVPKDGPKASNGVVRNGKTLSLRWGAAATPVLHDGLVIVNASEESNSIRALDAKTGELVWKLDSPNLEGSAASPMIAGKGKDSVLVVVLAGEVWGLAPKSGKRIWRINTATRGGMSPMPVADERHVYCFGGGGKAFAVRFGSAAGDANGKQTDDAKKTEQSSKDKSERSGAKAAAAGEAEAKAGDGADQSKLANQPRVTWMSANLDIPSPLLHDGRLFLVRTRGTGLVLDARNGKVLFEERLDGRTGSIYASPVLADGRLYVVSRKRGVFVYSAKTKPELLARNVLDDDSQFNASPAIVGKALYLRSDRFLYCISEA